MKHLIIILFLITSFGIGGRVSVSGEIEDSKGLHRYSKTLGNNIVTCMSEVAASNTNNLIITKYRFSDDYKNSKPVIGLQLIKNDEMFGFGIAIVKPVFSLFQ